MTPAEREADRIRAELQRRDREIGREFYALTSEPNLFTRHGQERALLHGLAEAHLLPLAGRTVLEIGCGRGQWLGVFQNFGACAEALAGIDLDADRIAEARRSYPGADLRVGDATKLPWDDQAFDIVFQSTVFTSILDRSVQAAVAREMLRIVRPGGTIVWYDFRYDNPRNRNVRGVGAARIRELFPSCQVSLTPVTLATPLARLVVPRSWLVARALERFGALRTHYLGLIRQRA